MKSKVENRKLENSANDVEILNYKEHHLQNFLKKHPAINVTQIEIDANVPKDTLRHFVKNRRSLPVKYFESIEKVLSNYGYIPMESE